MNLFTHLPRRRIAAGALIALAAALAITSGAVPGSTPSAQALVGCPPQYSGSKLGGWVPVWRSRGVTVCLATEKADVGQHATLQIVDLSAGAKLRVISRVASGSTPGFPQTLFERRTTSGWDSWIRTNASSASLPASRLFSEVNASFFINGSPLTTPTELSLPEMTGHATKSQGWALTHMTDPAWPRAKASIVFNDPTVARQTVLLRNFPTSYGPNDIANAFLNHTDGTVGFQPLAGDTVKADPRTMVGIDGSGTLLYILSSQSSLTLGEANSILTTAGTTFRVQLDGGCSTQMYSKVMADQHIQVGVGGCRPVPDVLAVWMAP